jgi:hypothetical protein
MAATRRDTPELLDVQMEEFTGVLTDVAYRRSRGAIQIRQTGKTVTAENAVDSGAGSVDCPGQPVRPHLELLPRLKDAMDLPLRQRVGTAPWTRGPVIQSCFPLFPVAPEPLPGGSAGHPDGFRGLGHRPAALFDSLDKEQSSKGGQFSVTMSHKGLLSVWSFFSVAPNRAERLLCVNNVGGNYT